MLTTEEYLYFTDRAFDGMAAVLTELGDELANRRPELPGANTPYAIVTHCIGVVDHWAGRLVAGRPLERDRDAEFRASGKVADLLARIEEAKGRLREYVAVAEPRAPLHEEAMPRYRDTLIGRTQGAALQHVYEELAQHHGQLELTRDVLLG
ncbi:mycothiol transferase [Amycolatopsis pithecellobii]|uniref:DUF664 domain-containing protein n=1 Tax=Amycolatopsis pithecellobii TaxID=664692 RepID=A0A6N7YZC7_9PSEU|nr:DUF664 domain-containing protein [Amycolatopsis pithecellobii]MTD52821.1 DUF664 domain-containing protein [Amycolatopsis pithecellobii]